MKTNLAKLAAIGDAIVKENTGKPVSSLAVAGMRLANESRTPDHTRAIDDAVKSLQARLRAMAAEYIGDTAETGGLIERISRAAAESAVLARDPRAAVSMPYNLKLPQGFSENDKIMSQGLGFLEGRKLAVENYDNSDIQNAAQLTAAYNLTAPLQSEAAELLFPTFVVSPDQPGFNIAISRTVLQAKLQRGVSGAASKWGNVNLIRALRRPRLLNNDTLEIKPIYRKDDAVNVEAFVDAALVEPTEDSSDGEVIMTSYLKTGYKVDLLALGQTNAMTARGMANETDALDRYVVLRDLLLKVGDDLVNIPVLNYSGAAFTFAPQGDSRKVTLAMDVDNAPLTYNVKKVNGSPLTSMAAMVTNKWTVRLALMVSGTSNLRDSITSVFHNNIAVESIVDENGNEVSLLAGAGKTFATLVGSGEIIGYKIKANRANLNLRQLGSLVDYRDHNEFHPIGLRAPISTRRAISDNQTNTFADVQRLVQYTHFTIEAEAMETVKKTAAYLSTYVTAPDPLGIGPDILGSGRWYVIPSFIPKNVKVDEEIMSEESSERRQDIKGLLVTYLTDMAANLYVDSELIAMMRAVYGPSHPKVTFALLTTPRIATYLQIDGELRTLGPDINVRIVTTINEDYKDEIYMVPVIVGEGRNEQPSVANFGVLGYAPEVTSTVQVPRDGQMSTELTITPRFQHYVMCPVMGHLTVENLEDSLGRIDYNVNVVSMPSATP